MTHISAGRDTTICHFISYIWFELYGYHMKFHVICHKVSTHVLQIIYTNIIYLKLWVSKSQLNTSINSAHFLAIWNHRPPINIPQGYFTLTIRLVHISLLLPCLLLGDWMLTMKLLHTYHMVIMHRSLLILSVIASSKWD